MERNNPLETGILVAISAPQQAVTSRSAGDGGAEGAVSQLSPSLPKTQDTARFAFPPQRSHFLTSLQVFA